MLCDCQRHCFGYPDQRLWAQIQTLHKMTLKGSLKIFEEYLHGTKYESTTFKLLYVYIFYMCNLQRGALHTP